MNFHIHKPLMIDEFSARLEAGPRVIVASIQASDGKFVVTQ